MNPTRLAHGSMKVLNWAPATGPPAGRQRRGSAEGRRPSASRGANPPHLARRGEMPVTKTHELRPALSVNTPPDHVLPLAHFPGGSSSRFFLLPFLGRGCGMFQPFGTKATTVSRLPHAKAITGQIILYLENLDKAAKWHEIRGPVLGGYPVRCVSV
jgi:hypothetical protein